MKLTNLEMTQSILSNLGSDEVNSISDTTESMQVAECIKQSYFNIITRNGATKNEGTFQLNPSLDDTKPVLMFKPEHILKMDWIKYYDDSTDSPQYNYVTILPVAQFLDMITTFNTDEVNVETLSFTVDGLTYNLAYFNDRKPHYCTVFSNYYILFDAFNKTVDTTLQASKTMCFGLKSPQWSMIDSFIPDLDEQQFSLLLNEAKSLAFFELKQIPHPKAEQEVKRQWNSFQRDRSLVNKPSAFDQLPNLGRNPMGGRYSKIIW